jgi:hypothetical protein
VLVTSASLSSTKKRTLFSRLSLSEPTIISLKEEQNLEIYQDVIVSSEESTANESLLQKVLAIELITVKMMILRQSKRRRALFRKRKFDVLIESI